MPRPSKIIALGLEDAALSSREQALSLAQTAAKLNALLEERGAADTVSASAVKRYLARLDRATVAVVHRPQLAEANAALATDVGEQLTRLNEILLDWLEDARSAQRLRIGGDGRPVALGPDWNARLGVARELRLHTESYANALESIYAVRQVQMFQEAVMEAIEAAAPDVARDVTTELEKRQHLLRAALAGPG